MSDRQSLAAEAIDIVLSNRAQRDTRLALGDVLRRLFNADVFVSYVYDSSGPYTDPVELNMGPGSLEAYAKHFRYVDRLTPQLFAAGTATATTVARSGRDEFVADFLKPQDMWHGLNYFPRGAELGAIDLRLWRGRSGRPFSEIEIHAFRAYGDLLARFWPQASGASSVLTPRELQVAELVAEGLGDKQIAHELGISIPTLRTHLRHAFEKTGAVNRVALARHFLHHRQL